MQPTPTDEELAEAAAAGERAAYTQLAERYQYRLLKFLLGRSVSHADAEDAVQDTLVNAYRHIHTFNPRWRFSTWIYRIAIRATRRKAARLSNEVSLDKEAVDAVADDGAKTDPLLACVATAERDNLWITVRDSLSEDAYAALWLRYAEDMSIAEVASAVQRSTSWTKVSLMRSRRRLGQVLKAAAGPGEQGASNG